MPVLSSSQPIRSRSNNSRTSGISSIDSSDSTNTSTSTSTSTSNRCSSPVRNMGSQSPQSQSQPPQSQRFNFQRFNVCLSRHNILKYWLCVFGLPSLIYFLYYSVNMGFDFFNAYYQDYHACHSLINLYDVYTDTLHAHYQNQLNHVQTALIDSENLFNIALFNKGVHHPPILNPPCMEGGK